MRSTILLAPAGFLILAAVAAVGAMAAQHPRLSPAATESKTLVPVAQRTMAPRAPFRWRLPSIGRSGRSGGPGVGVYIPGLVPEKKPKIPAPVHCVPAEKVGAAVMTPMSQLPPPQICTGKVLQLKKNVTSSQTTKPFAYPGSAPAGTSTVVEAYCLSCKYSGDFVLLGIPKNWAASFEKVAKHARCARCPSKYAWDPVKGKCCNHPNK
jgi:hypothetical protein